MPQPDGLFLGHMLSAMDRLSELLARIDQDAFDRDWVIQDAVICELEILGEAAAPQDIVVVCLRAHGLRASTGAAGDRAALSSSAER